MLRSKEKFTEVIIIDSAEYVAPFATLVYGIIILVIIIAAIYVCYYLITDRRL
jgi:prolipoprotein diacylglyceryltransferase